MFTRASLAFALLVVSITVFLTPTPAQEQSSVEEIRADSALRKITEKAKSTSLTPAKLRQELHNFRLAHPGTLAAVKAAVLFSELASPLDKLHRDKIPELEQFHWQPKELVGVLGEHRGRHGNAVASVTFNHDGSYLASGGGQYVRLWNPSTMRLLARVGHGAVTSVAFTRDGKVLVSGSAYGSVCVWDIGKEGTLQLRFQVQAATSAVYGVACHPNNKIIACACFDNLVRLYDITGKKIEEAGQVSGHARAVRCLTYSPDGKSLATGSEDQSARIWDVTNDKFKEKSRIEGHTGSVLSVAFSRLGTSLATGCSDGSICIWNMPAAAKPKAPRLRFQNTKGAVTSLMFSEKGTTLAATDGSNKARLWNLSSGKLVKDRYLFEGGHKDRVNSVAYSPDMKLIATGGEDWTVRTWDLGKGKPVERFEPWSHLSHVYSVAHSTDGETLASGSYDRVVRFWDLARPEPKTRNYLPFDGPVFTVAYSPDGRLVAAGGQSTTIKQWDAAKGTTRSSCTGNPDHVRQICYSANSKSLLVRTGKEVILYETARGREIKRFGPHETPVTSIGFSPDSKRAISTSGYYKYDDKNRIVMKDGKYVYTDCVLKVWDVEKGEVSVPIKKATTPFYSANFSADGRTLYSGNYEATLRRMTLSSDKAKELDPWKGSSGYLTGVWETPDGKYLLSQGLNYSLILWDISTGKVVKAWSFQEQMGGVAIASDSRHIAVGLGTGVIYILRIAPPKAKPDK